MQTLLFFYKLKYKRSLRAHDHTSGLYDLDFCEPVQMIFAQIQVVLTQKFSSSLFTAIATGVRGTFTEFSSILAHTVIATGVRGTFTEFSPSCKRKLLQPNFEMLK